MFSFTFYIDILCRPCSGDVILQQKYSNVTAGFKYNFMS